MKEKIDIVYLWCDGSDPIFRSQKESLLNKLNLDCKNEENLGDIRYLDNDELKYSLRSIYKNIDFFNHIYIITNNQKPKWLKECSKISIIDHKEIIPEKYLPTFSSPAIEFFIPKIRNLAEKFIYFNDDMFVMRKLSVSNFF